jgi:hypothetical protein
MPSGPHGAEPPDRPTIGPDGAREGTSTEAAWVQRGTHIVGKHCFCPCDRGQGAKRELESKERLTPTTCGRAAARRKAQEPHLASEFRQLLQEIGTAR